MARTGAAADRVAAEVSDRLERLASAAAENILGSLYAPQVASPARAARLGYFRSVLLPDGVFSPEGRDRIVAEFGAPEYYEIAQGLAKTMRDEAAVTERILRLARSPRGEPPIVFGPRTQPRAA